MKEHQSLKNTFSGSLDMDSDINSVKPDNWIDAETVRIGKNRGEKYNVVSNMKGTELIPYVQQGNNVSLGALESKSKNLSYSFVWNDAGDMEIREFNLQTKEQRLIVRYDFGWEQDKYISNSSIIDDKILMWTDRIPRRINIDKSRPDKIHKGNIYFISNTDPFTPIGTLFTVNIIDESGAIIATDSMNMFVSASKDATAGLISLFINSSNSLSSLATAEKCEDFVEISFKNEGYFRITVTTNNNTKGLYVPQNYYLEITDQIVDAGKYPLNCPPKVALKNDVSRAGFNNIERTVWQFATQVIYDDFDRSTFSPYSDIVLVDCGGVNNYIEIDYSDDVINNATSLSIIKSVVLLGRLGNVGKWRRIATIDPKDLWLESGELGKNTFRFFNDGEYSIVDDTDALLAYSDLPIKVVEEKYDMTQVLFSNRIAYGNFIENYEEPCIQANLTANFQEIDSIVYSISLIVRIRQEQQFFTGGSAINPANYGRGNIGAIYIDEDKEFPYFGAASGRGVPTGEPAERGQQILPEGGFLAYLAGTDHIGISKQRTDVQNGTLQFTSSGAIDTTSQAGRDLLKDWYTEYEQTNGAIGDMFSVATIKGVKKGKYILRLASHWCSFGDKLNKGAFYNVLSNKRYQQTSTTLRSIRPNINGTYLNEFDGTELIIEIDDNGVCTISNYTGILGSFTNNSGEFFIGDFFVEDLAVPDNLGNINLEYESNFSMYVMDGGGLTDDESIRKGVRTELCLLSILAPTSLRWDTRLRDGNRVFLFTDHNGFQYFKNAVSFNGQGIDAIKYNNIDGRNSINEQILITEDLSDNPSILFDLYEGDINRGALVNFQFSGKHRQAVIYTTNTNFTNECRTVVTGRISEANGEGVAGVPVNITRNGAIEKTQADGTFSILVYRDGIFGNEDRVLDQIILSSNDCSIMNYLSSNTSYTSFPLTIAPINANGFNNNVPYAPAFLNDVLLSFLVDLSRKLKAGFRGSFGLFYVDKLNRRHSVVTNNLEIAIPFFTEQRQDYFDNVGIGQSNGIFTFTLNVTTPPPDWADKLYLVRTIDDYYSDYLQMPLFDVKYVLQYDSVNSIPIETTFATFAANEIYLGFVQSAIAYKENNTSSLKGWTYQEGDRVRFYIRDNGELFDKLYDLPIKGERKDASTEFTYYAIDNLDALGEIKEGTLVEVYRPKRRTDDDLLRYFEIHSCIDIQNGTHVGLPLKIETGDAYLRTRNVPIQFGNQVNFIEDNSLSDDWQSREQDIGRMVIKSSQFGQLKRFHAIRFSNIYVPGSMLNGLSRFEPLNIVEYPRQYGRIQKTVLVNDNAERQVILTACENNTFSIYVGESILSDLRGGDLISISDKVLGTFRTLLGDYGTRNPESFSVIDGRVFFWDANRQHVVRYDYNGLDAISEIGARNYFLEVGYNDDVISVFDDFYKEFIIYPKTQGMKAICYKEDRKGWGNKYPYDPDVFGSVGEFIISYKNGDLYLHDTGNINEIYGVKHNSRITVSVNQYPLVLKMAYGILTKSSDIWYIPEDGISTEPDAMYPQGMRSELLEGHWLNAEGDYWGALLKDKNDPNPLLPTIAEKLLRGRTLRSHAFKLTLETNKDTLNLLRSVEMFIYQSENTK